MIKEWVGTGRIIKKKSPPQTQSNIPNTRVGSKFLHTYECREVHTDKDQLRLVSPDLDFLIRLT